MVISKKYYRLIYQSMDAWTDVWASFLTHLASQITSIIMHMFYNEYV